MVANSKKRASISSYLDYEAGCLSSVTVADFVYVNGNIDGVLQVAKVDISNLNTLPAFGIVIEKITPLLCKVRVSGEVVTTQNLIPGKRYFIGHDGALTSSVPDPTEGNKVAVQAVAYALDTNRLILTFTQTPLIRVD